MAIITTKYAFGWYGEKNKSCTDFDLSTELGSFSFTDGKLVFQTGSQNFSEDEIKTLSVFALDTENAQSWTLDSEMNKFTRDGALSDNQLAFHKLECGRMYFITNPNLTEVHIPNFVPTAIDVDMGRINK